MLLFSLLQDQCQPLCLDSLNSMYVLPDSWGLDVKKRMFLPDNLSAVECHCMKSQWKITFTL